MHVVAFHSAKERDAKVVGAFCAGVVAAGTGDTAAALEGDYPVAPRGADAAVVFGVKGRARFDSYRAAGLQVVYLDKGYLRGLGREKYTKHWRVAVNAHHPTDYLASLRSPPDRWRELGLEFSPWRRATRDGPILYAGSSAKAHRFNRMGEPNAVAQRTVRQLRALTSRPVVYRPKPTWREARPVLGASFQQDGGISALLPGAHALVTYISNSCWEAAVAGVPSVVLGSAVARPISSTRLEEIESPRLATDAERTQWFSDLAYCQYTIDEMRAGEMWRHVRRVLEMR